MPSWLDEPLSMVGVEHGHVFELDPLYLYWGCVLCGLLRPDEDMPR